MPIFSDERLNDIFNERQISDNIEDIKKVNKKISDNIKSNVKKNTDCIKNNVKRTMKIKLDSNGDLINDNKDDDSLIEESITVNNVKYKKLTKAEEKDKNLIDTIIINGKKYKKEKEKESKYNRNHPTETIGKSVGSVAGASVGAAIGGPVGSLIGSSLGTGVGAVTGKTITSNKIGKKIDKKISSIIKPKKKVNKEDFDFRNVYRSKEFNMAIEEYFDISDTETRTVLLAINEEDQNRVLIGLTSKLYENIIDKIDDIDFGEIPMTKGDITKLSNFHMMIESINNMRKLLIEFKQDTKPVDMISNAIDNIIDSTNIWKRSFTGNIELPMVMYNTTVMAIIEAVSYMISMCVEYIKIPSSDSFQIVIDKSALSKTKNHLVFDNLSSFNDAYKKGQITKSMEYVIKENVKNFGGMVGIGIGATLAGISMLLFCIIPIIRELVFLFYYNRVRVSEYFDVQANMLQMNAYNIENNRLDLDKEDKKKITNKQIKIANKFRDISNKISISASESENKAIKDMTTKNKKYKTAEVVDELPDSASSALF